MDMGEWLRSIGLGQYEAAFRDNEIEDEVLRNLTADDLKDLGVALVGHRRKILTAIAELSAPAPDSPAKVDTERTPPIGEPPKAPAERRQLTVLFCDLAGSTAMSARLDPEDMREVIRGYQDICSGVIARYDGFVAKFMGDGVLAYFGFPRAHEDDAERAVRAGLDLADAVASLQTRDGEALRTRIGIATGIVVVGDLVGQGSAQEQAVVGDTPNLAARLQTLAETGAVLIADQTRRLLGDAFELKPLDLKDLKGFDAPVRAWAVLREAETETRFEASRSSRMTPFVGREPEVALLIERWRDACAGEGKVALLSGEAGIGKSRILTSLLERLADEPHLAIRYQCSPHHVNDAFHPFVSQILRAAEFAAEEAPKAKLEKLEAMARRSRLELTEIVPFVASLCSIPFEGHYPPIEMSPAEQKERLIAALLALFEGLTMEAPVLALLEDAHWIDPSSLEVFSRLVDRIPKMRAFLIITYRPEFVPPWLGRGHVHSLALSRFGRRHALAMIDRVAGGKALPAEVLEEIVAKTDGVPLFVEELTKTVLESGLLREQNGSYVLASALTPLAIPSTLQDSLMARLDRLAPIKEIAQIGATIGREFPYNLLEAVSPTQGVALQDALAQLVTAGLIFSHGTPPEASYTFKHALVQDTAYATLLKSRRQQLHERIAESLRDRFPERAEREPGIVAHHFTQAGLPKTAIEWWGRAGDRAMRRFANHEAALSYANGLSLMADLPAGEERDRQELVFRLALGPALLAARGYASEEVERNYQEASRLAEALSDREAIFTSARGQWHYLYDRSLLARALALAERLRDIGAEESNTENSSLAFRAIGSTLMSKGEFVRAIEAFESSITHGSQIQLGSSFAHHGEEPCIVALQYKGLSLAVRGYADSGLASAQSALSLAKTLNFPLMVAFASTAVGMVFMLRREYQPCSALVRQQIEFCSEQGFVFWSAAHEILHGASRACLNRDPEGLVELKEGIQSWKKTGAALHIPTWSSYLAEAALCVGDVDCAERAVFNGIDTSEKNGDAFALAELKRLAGRVLLRRDLRNQARREFEEAVDIAQRQDAGLYLLRSGRDLAQLVADDDNVVSARDILSPIADRITEFRTGPDFQEAAALLSTFARAKA
ncbi:MAG TPA: adenylate/guanylate cyclase domain-containing protein [Gemmataceae bacterium]|nr:adenylate/guanylate cyclase domain-containing protein [Gemmataceae bacterium]